VRNLCHSNTFIRLSSSSRLASSDCAYQSSLSTILEEKKEAPSWKAFGWRLVPEESRKHGDFQARDWMI